MGAESNGGKRCERCGKPMTWAMQRVQYGRILKRGYSKNDAKELAKQCQKCVTKFLKWRKACGTEPIAKINGQ